MPQTRPRHAAHITAALSGYHLAPGLRAELPPRAERAFVTLVTRQDDLPGVAALLRSLRLSGTAADIAVMHHNIPPEGLAQLRALGARLIAAEPLPISQGFKSTHAFDVQQSADLPCLATHRPQPALDRFIRLRLWQLDYARCVFIEADALVLRPVDKLFDFPEFCAAPDLCHGLEGFHRMNSGVFTARPDASTFRHMLSRLDRPGQVWRRAEQSFLQSYFPDWHGLPIRYNLMQHVWVNLPELWNWGDIHILRFQHEKPWERQPRTPKLAPLVALWQQIAAGAPIPDLAQQQRPAG